MISIIKKTRASPRTWPKEKIGGINRLSIGNHMIGSEEAFPRRFITTYYTPILRGLSRGAGSKQLETGGYSEQFLL